jgi:biotin carboxyl carrier protein
MVATTSVFSIADEYRARAESSAWSVFTAPDDDSQFCTAWLALLCARVERARAALVLVDEEGASAFTVQAAWPDPQRDLQYLGPAAQRALTERQGVLVGADGGPPGADGAAYIAYPVLVDEHLFGAVVLDVAAGAAKADLQLALRQVHWGSAWLVDHFRRRLMQRRAAELARVSMLNEVMATALEFRGLQPSALAVANELARSLSCDRVSIGFEQSGQVLPLVMSHAATFDRRSDLVRTLGDAMDEVLDLGLPVGHPAANGDEIGGLAHEDAATRLHVAALLSVPLPHEGRTIGVMTFERAHGPVFAPAEQALAQAMGVTLGRVWALQQSEERGIASRLSERGRAALRALFGPHHPGLKLAGLLALLFLGLAVFVKADYRISARTAIEGSTQLAAVAPFEGYVRAALVRAGDLVHRGQPLAALDDRDLLLERSRWHAEIDQIDRKIQAAMAAADRSSMSVLAAQRAEAQAQFALADDKISRATLKAPVDGIVVSGDLSQQIGSPVEQGKLLFEVAPLNDYRVVLQVDDRDMVGLATGQHGVLVLSSLPQMNLPLAVTAITPVATQRDGRNVFRVEARITGPTPPNLRPGMEGVAKVSIGERRLLWIWTHGFVDWLRLALWNWAP